MQCTSFLPGCYSSRDVNMGANGVAWPIYNNERPLKGQSYNVFLLPQNKNQLLIYDKELKEVLRQTMLKHESIFRDQVHELHRLYRRQRDLMDEIKRRELVKQQLKLPAYQSNSFLPTVPSETAQDTWKVPSLPSENFAAGRFTISGAEDFQSSSRFSEWKSTQASLNSVQAYGSLNDWRLSPSECKKPKRKMLDLELPADEYIDSEEEDQFGERKDSNALEVPHSEVSQKRSLKLLPSGGVVNFNTFAKRTHKLADLNEPCCVVDAVASNSTNFLASETCNKVITHLDQKASEKSKSGFPAFSREVDSGLQTVRAVEASLNSTHPEIDNKQKLLSNEAGIRISDSHPHVSSSGKLFVPFKQLKTEHPSEGDMSCFPCSSDRVSVKSMDLNMPPCCFLDLEVLQQGVGSKDEEKKLEDSQAALLQPIEKPDFSTKPDEEREVPQSDLVSSQAFTLAFSFNSHSESLKEEKTKPNQDGVCDNNLASCPPSASRTQSSIECVSIDIIVDTKFSGICNQLDLNSCINEDDPSPNLPLSDNLIKKGAETDLEAPVSPENKECSPPRGESEENQLDTPIKLSQQEDRDQRDELVRMAAEALVSISTPGLQKLLFDIPVCETLESSCNSLSWFAEIVSSKANDLENEVGVVLSSKDSGDQLGILSDGSDYFEAMTLELNEMKVEEYSSIITNQKEEVGSVLSPGQPRRGRTRRLRQSKDFQTEVLPSLTSLSRHEVTEDLQTIGGLMEAAGFAVEINVGRRSMGRCLRAKRRSSNSFSHEMENSIGPLLKQQNTDLELKSWGKMNRRRRAPRIPARTPPQLFS